MDQDRKAAAPPSSPTPGSGTAFGPPNNVGRSGQSGQSPKKRKNWLRLAVWALASCVLLCVLAIAGALVALRNEGVQGWLTDKINAALEAAPPDRGAAPQTAGSGLDAQIGGRTPFRAARVGDPERNASQSMSGKAYASHPICAQSPCAIPTHGSRGHHHRRRTSRLHRRHHTRPGRPPRPRVGA